MSYFTKYAPATVDDLVFQNAKVSNLVREFAQGAFDHHLMMYGPAGSGKTSAARMILKARLQEDIEDYCFHGRDITVEKIKQMEGLRNCQRGFFDRAYFLIDEVDECTKVMRQHLRSFMNVNPNVTIICTTNYLTQIELEDSPFVDRFETVEFLVPALGDWMPRLMSITAAEGVPISSENLRGVLMHNTISARTLLRETEKLVAELRSVQISTASQNTDMKIKTGFQTKLSINRSDIGD